MEQDIKRFQNCNWLVKLWRYRRYAYIPFRWLRWKIGAIIDPEHQFSDKAMWRILIGSAQCDMHWYYTSEEVFKDLK